jgi:hypothetical protein
LVCGLLTTATVAVVPGSASATPVSKLAPTCGMVIATTEPADGTAVTLTRRPLRSGVLPWLKTMTAPAPAA